MKKTLISIAIALFVVAGAVILLQAQASKNGLQSSTVEMASCCDADASDASDALAAHADACCDDAAHGDAAHGEECCDDAAHGDAAHGEECCDDATACDGLCAGCLG